MAFPITRMRRLRANPLLRKMVRATRVGVEDLIAPLFVRTGTGLTEPIASMPGQYQFSVDTIGQRCRQIEAVGVPAILLFGVPDRKDSQGTDAYNEHGVVQRAIEAIKGQCPNLLVITDVCLCQYTDHGHCGVVVQTRSGREVDNDATLELLRRQAVSHARAGADMVAPSDMMDGRVGAIRAALDETGFANLPILSYAAKFASSYYGPFRDAAASAPEFGDRRSYQMDFCNAEEALREVALDIEEGADIVMVKPAVNYLDIIYRVKRRFGVPTAAYHVSGEYAMIKAAGQNGWLDEKQAAIEATVAIKRAGADLILTYFAEDLARWLEEG
jgi:porphobilinogen synthase